MPLNFSYITSHQPIYNGGIWIIDIHRSFQRLFSPCFLIIFLIYVIYGSPFTNTKRYISNASTNPCTAISRMRERERDREGEIAMANAAVSRCTHEPIRGGPHVNKVRTNNLRNALNSPLVCGFATK